MNYIKHLTGFFNRISEDERLSTTHIALYMALFQFWNINRFKNPISINRTETLQMSKIGSYHTYHKCIKELDTYGYIRYLPSHNPIKGSKVYMFNFDTTSVQAENNTSVKNSTSSDQPLHPSLNIVNNTNKTEETVLPKIENKIPPEKEEIISFFKSEKGKETEAQKFFYHYAANGWRIGNNKMENWHAAAKNWIIKSNEYTTKNKDNFKKDKNYGEPL